MKENNQLRDVYDAIADPTRRSLIRLLAEAGLVIDRKVGRETRFRLNASLLQEIQDWVAFYSKIWLTNILLLNELLEEEET